jgi:hypothetical protein
VRRPKAPTSEQVLKVLGEFARGLLVDPEYHQKLRRRVIDGLAGDKAETMLINIGINGIGEPRDTPPATVADKKKRGRGKVIPMKPKET